VTGDAPALNTVDATIGNAFSETQVRQLPLATRNVVELLSLQAGVTQTGEVLGARRDQNNVTLDGVDVNDNQTSGSFGRRVRATARTPARRRRLSAMRASMRRCRYRWIRWRSSG
jgi:hypothetical protein